MQEKEDLVSKPQSHIIADRAPERMTATDLRQESQLLLGRLPRCLPLMEDNLNEVEIGSSMERAPNRKRSQDRLWKGLAEDVLRDKKSLHCVLKRNSLSINSDGVLSNKPGDEQKHEENVIFAPLEQQLSVSNVSNRSSQLKLEARSEEPNDTKDDPPNHWGHDLSSLQLHEVSTVQQQEEAKKPKQKQENPVGKPQSISTTADKPQNASSTESTENRQRPANSTHFFDLGFPTRYNLHDRELSRQHATAVGLKPDSTRQNREKPKPEIVSAIEGKECLIPKKPAFSRWNVNDLHEKERRDLDPTITMTEERYVGKLHSQTRGKIHITDEDQIILSEKEAYKKKILLAAQANYYKEGTLAISAPRPKYDEYEEHNELTGLKIKWHGLQQYENLSVFWIINTNEAIVTEWPVIENQKQKGVKRLEAKVCLAENMNEPLHKICRQVPIVSRPAETPVKLNPGQPST